MQIQTIEQKTGLDRATIRYYEQEGLIKPLRLQNGYRDYSETHLQDLIKIKLLRQLGLSLESISRLIEGEDDLQSVLENQLLILKEHKTQVENAEFVCKMILEDRVTYETIVPSKYYTLPGEKPSDESKVIDSPYREYVRPESHPIRRYIARKLDHLLLSGIFLLIIIVILRIRPFGEVHDRWLSIVLLFLTMPINALFLHYFGTTPGKFALGIHIKTPEGRNLTFREAMRREWAVFYYEMGCCLPIYKWVRMVKSYKLHSEGQGLEWDYGYNSEVIYRKFGIKYRVLCTILCILSIGSVIYTSVDAQLPKHRQEKLTLAQFAENYNDYAKLDNMDLFLSEEGEWYTPETQANSVIIELFNHDESWQFITDSNQYLKQIKIDIVSDSSLYFWGEGRIAKTIHTAIMSQPNAELITAYEAAAQLSELTYIGNLKDKQFDFSGVHMNIAVLERKPSTNEPVRISVDITLP